MTLQITLLKYLKRKVSNNTSLKDELIEKAWCDKTDFDSIYETENLNENDVQSGATLIRNVLVAHDSPSLAKLRESANS